MGRRRSLAIQALVDMAVTDLTTDTMTLPLAPRTPASPPTSSPPPSPSPSQPEPTSKPQGWSYFSEASDAEKERARNRAEGFFGDNKSTEIRSFAPKPHRCNGHLEDLIVGMSTWPPMLMEPSSVFWKCLMSGAGYV